MFARFKLRRLTKIILTIEEVIPSDGDVDVVLVCVCVSVPGHTGDAFRGLWQALQSRSDWSPSTLPIERIDGIFSLFRRASNGAIANIACFDGNVHGRRKIDGRKRHLCWVIHAGIYNGFKRGGTCTITSMVDDPISPSWLMTQYHYEPISLSVKNMNLDLKVAEQQAWPKWWNLQYHLGDKKPDMVEHSISPTVNIRHFKHCDWCSKIEIFSIIVWLHKQFTLKQKDLVTSSHHNLLFKRWWTQL